MDTYFIEKIDETYIKVTADPALLMELSDYFTFDVPGAKFTPAYRNKVWDGKIRLLNIITGLLYSGLIHYIEDFCKQRKYDVKYLSDFSSTEFSVKEANDFIKSLNLTIQPRDYQISAFVKAIRDNRKLLLSPTASGKSLIIYLLTRYYNTKTLIIVPTTSLVSQMSSDFLSYGYDDTDNIHKIYSGQEKYGSQQIFISTWQSIYKLPKEWFNQFNLIIGDEAHLFKAKSLTTILSKLNKCKYRFGFTGTLDGSQTHQLVLEGLFGPVHRVTTTSELIDQKHLSDFRIKNIVLTYPDDIRKLVSKMDYQQEIDYIVKLTKRNSFISNLALSLQGNTLLLFQYVDKHGKVLYDNLKTLSPDRNIFFISGEIDGEERERIRKAVEEEKNAIIVASTGTFSTGVNIKNLHNIIFSSPSKSRIKNLQSIGRVLRKSDSKTHSVLYDIADDLTWKNRKNFTILHFMERVKIYNEEKFNYKIFNVSIKP
jgi:superfamily II DNA or RNA helicase